MKIVKLYSLSVGFFLLSAALIASALAPSPAPTNAPATGATPPKGAPAPAKGSKEAKAARKARPIFETSDNDATPNWIVVDYKSDTPGNVFYNNETVKLSLTLASQDPQKPLTIKKGTWQIKEIKDAERWPSQSKQDQKVTETDVVSGEGAIPQPSGGKIPVTIDWKPTHLGAYCIYLNIDDGSGADPQIVWGFVVVYPPAPGRKLDSPLIFNLGAKEIADKGPAHQRLGVKWVRGEISWASNEKDQGVWDWSESDEWTKAAKDNDLYCLEIMAHAPDWAKPKIDGTIPIYYWKSFPETNSTPEHLSEWQEWAKQFVSRYKDTVRAGDCLNEPWEGGSLSGWNATGAHYREIFKNFAIGAHAGDPTFKVLANDSSMNVEDNLEVEPGLINYLDAVSTHTFRSYNAFIIPEFAAYGKPVWDTESWAGAGPNNLVQQAAFELAQGIVKMQPLNGIDAFFNTKLPRAVKVANKKKGGAAPAATEAAFPPIYATPTAQGLSIFLHFIEDTDFYHEVNPESVPWMFVFKGRASGPSPDKNVAIIEGRDFKWDNFPWYQVKSDGQLTVSDPDHVLTVYDIEGNPLPRTGTSLTIPLTAAIYYVVSSKGADDLLQRLKDATVQGLEPVEITLNDFTKPLAQNPPLQVKVSNNYNVPISGTVEVKAPEGWKMADASLPFSGLKPGASTELSFKVAGTKTTPINRYPFTITAKTDKGNATWSEDLSSTVLVKGTPPLDGKAEDWEKLGAVPVFLSGSTTAADTFLQYTMPFLNLQAENDSAYVVQFMGMWDDKNFYILADINDPTEKLPVSISKGTWFTTHAPPNDYEYWGPHSTPGSGGDRLNIAFNVLPYGEKQIANYPPEAQKKLDPKWQVDRADYEYSLYLGKQKQVVKGDYEKAVEQFKSGDRSNGGALRQPTFEEVGPPVPEVWRLMSPGLMWNNYCPTSPRVANDQGLVTGAKLSVTREGTVYHYRAAIPWSELSMVKPLAMAGKPVKFSFVGVNDGRDAVSWSNKSRSVSKQAQEVLHPTFMGSFSPDTEWGFVDLAATPKP